MIHLLPIRRRGFSLIELMIALAIVGIVTAVAYPNYVSYIQRAKRAEAESVMLEAVQYLQRYYVSHNGYADANIAAAGFAKSPKGATGSSVAYNITLDIPIGSTQSYTLSATLAVANENDPCGVLTLTDTGAKGQSAEGATTAKCWR